MIGGLGCLKGEREETGWCNQSEQREMPALCSSVDMQGWVMISRRAWVQNDDVAGEGDWIEEVFV